MCYLQMKQGFPKKISVETTRHWLHVLGFEMLTAKKGCFVDGHEHADGVEYRQKFFAENGWTGIFELKQCTH